MWPRVVEFTSPAEENIVLTGGPMGGWGVAQLKLGTIQYLQLPPVLLFHSRKH